MASAVLQLVYDLARHLFEKVGYHGKHYSFSNKTHISRVGNEQIGSVLDVMRRYAREQGGMFVEENLVQYLQNVGLKTGNLHGQMKLNEEPIFLYYQPDVLITSESLQLNDAWFAKAQQALDKLFSDLGDHIVLRDISHGGTACSLLCPVTDRGHLYCCKASLAFTAKSWAMPKQSAVWPANPRIPCTPCW